MKKISTRITGSVPPIDIQPNGAAPPPFDEDKIKNRIAQLESELAALHKTHADMVQQFRQRFNSNQQDANRLEGAIMALRALLTKT